MAVRIIQRTFHRFSSYKKRPNIPVSRETKKEKKKNSMGKTRTLRRTRKSVSVPTYNYPLINTHPPHVSRLVKPTRDNYYNFTTIQPCCCCCVQRFAHTPQPVFYLRLNSDLIASMISCFAFAISFRISRRISSLKFSSSTALGSEKLSPLICCNSGIVDQFHLRELLESWTWIPNRELYHLRQQGHQIKSSQIIYKTSLFLWWYSNARK